MELSETAEEALEALWMAVNEQGEPGLPGDAVSSEEAGELLRAGLVATSGGWLVLTEAGRPEAISVVRRHRLAERLLNDVLGSREGLLHERACRFEHLLDRGLDDSVCTLLGHPKVCPHGKQIPPGKCCLEEQYEPPRLVSPLSELEPGSRGKVAYVYAPEGGRLQKLLAMGVLPGAPIRLVQKFPSYVFEAGHSQFAVDEKIAGAIYVRLVADEAADSASPAGKEPSRRRRFGWWGRRQR